MSATEERKALRLLNESWRRLIAGARASVRRPPPEASEATPGPAQGPPPPAEIPPPR